MIGPAEIEDLMADYPELFATPPAAVTEPLAPQNSSGEDEPASLTRIMMKAMLPAGLWLVGLQPSESD